MPSTTAPRVEWDRYDGVLFDLDGVLTDTAELHAGCWKEMFDGFLRRRAERTGEAFVPFEIASDYRRHVDGKPRLNGIRDFLASRQIQLPEGDQDDPAGRETILGLSRWKNDLVVAAIDAGQVRRYDGSVALARSLRDAGKHLAVVTSSANCDAVLRAAGLDDLFEVRVDGVVAAEMGLPGKPAPDAFLAAAKRLGLAPQTLIVVEDAMAGVEAGRAGGFGLVIGVARHDNAAALRDHGAEVVVADLGDLNDPGGRA